MFELQTPLLPDPELVRDSVSGHKRVLLNPLLKTTKHIHDTLRDRDRVPEQKTVRSKNEYF